MPSFIEYNTIHFYVFLGVYFFFLRNGRSPICLMNMTLSLLARNVMLPSRNLLARLGSRPLCGFHTLSTIRPSKCLYGVSWYDVTCCCLVFVCLKICLNCWIYSSLYVYLSQRIIELNGGHHPLTYKRFQDVINRMDPVQLPAETVTLEVMKKCAMPISEDHDERFGVPTLEELGKVYSLFMQIMTLVVVCQYTWIYNYIF